MTSDPDTHFGTPPDWLEAAFLSAFHGEEASQSVDHYLRLFPGHEDQVRALHEQATALEARDEPIALPKLGRYVLQRELGRGGQGVVYLAEDPELQRQVAIKIRRESGLTGRGVSGLRWSREQRLAARIEHPGVCPILEYGQDDQCLYSVYPYVRGRSLRELIQVCVRLREDASLEVEPDIRDLADAIGLPTHADPEPAARRLAVERALEFHRKLALAVQAIHDQEIVHRDLKPANILVRDNAEPVILDLGLARDESEDRLILTQEGDRLGTPAYMAPEQLLSDHERVAPAADLWALGVILHECMMLARPFEGPTREVLYRNILDSKPEPLETGVPTIERPLRIVQETLLAKLPSGRYQTAMDLAEDLRRIVAREPILARRPSVLARARLWVRRKPVLASALLGLVGSLAAAAVILAMLLAQRDRTDAQMAAKQAALRQMSTEMLLDVQIELGKLPGTLALRKRMFEKAMAWLKVLESEEDRDAGLYRDLLEAHLGFGDVLGYPANPNLGDPRRAVKEYERALELVAELERGMPAGMTPVEVDRIRARAHRKLASTLYSLQEIEAVDGHFVAAVAASRRILQDESRTLEDRERHVAILGQMASTFNDMDRTEEALRHTTKASEMSRELLAEHPDDADIQANHGATLLIEALIQEKLGDRPAALKTLQDYEGRLQQAFDRHPARTALAHYVMVYASQTARLLFATGSADEALREFERALSLQAENQRRDPDNEMVARLGLRYSMEYATTLLATHQVDRGLQRAEKALADGQELLERYPRSPSLLRLTNQIRNWLIGTYAKVGREEDVRRLEVLRLEPASTARPDGGQDSGGR